MRLLRLLPLALVVVVLLSPLAEAAWTTTASAPASFRPNRAVTFTYTTTSNSALDLGTNWLVRLVTCTDTNADGVCTMGTDTPFHDFGELQLVVNPNSAGSVSWNVNLNDPPGAYRYDFTPRCTNTPCGGTRAPVAGDTKHGAFALAYTNTWTRTLIVPGFQANGTTGILTYRLASTSPDDPDLAGAAELFTTPNASAEHTEGARSISVLAGAQQTLSWDGVSFTPAGRQAARVLDSTTPAQAFGNTTVLDVHLHVHQPRPTYASSTIASLYLHLEGHGEATDPVPLSAPVRVIVRNGSFAVSNTTIQTDPNGTAYLAFLGAADLARVDWTANASFAWNGVVFSPTANGTILFASSDENLSALRQDVADLAFKGVHLDELGTHNLLLEVGRVALYAALIAGFVVLLVIVSFRV